MAFPCHGAGLYGLRRERKAAKCKFADACVAMDISRDRNGPDDAAPYPVGKAGKRGRNGTSIGHRRVGWHRGGPCGSFASAGRSRWWACRAARTVWMSPMRPACNGSWRRLDAPFDTIIVATGALEIAGARPEKSLKALDGAAMAAQFALNAIGPALVLKHALRLLPRDRPLSFCGTVGTGRRRSVTMLWAAGIPIAPARPR